MKTLLTVIICFFSTMFAIAQQKETKKTAPDPKKEILLVDAACGQCKLGLQGDDCDLAIRLNGTSYYVDGTKIDDHGDAHAKDGFCNAIRKARVQGEVVDGRFKATYFQLVPANKEKKSVN
jgi:hypothetical protein